MLDHDWGDERLCGAARESRLVTRRQWRGARDQDRDEETEPGHGE
jgi:hypothetical protein